MNDEPFACALPPRLSSSISTRLSLGHRVRDHEQCGHLHGHTFKVSAVVSTLSKAHPVNGVLAVKILHRYIHQFDHGFAVEEADSAVLELLCRIDSRRVVLDEPPTLEALVSSFFEPLAEEFAAAGIVLDLLSLSASELGESIHQRPTRVTP